MTLKKSNAGQAVFEYFVLTLVVVGILLMFAKHKDFLGIKEGCDKALDQAVQRMTE